MIRYNHKMSERNINYIQSSGSINFVFFSSADMVDKKSTNGSVTLAMVMSHKPPLIAYMTEKKIEDVVCCQSLMALLKV